MTTLKAHIDLLNPKSPTVFVNGKSRKVGNNRRAGHRLDVHGRQQRYYTLHGHEIFTLTTLDDGNYELALSLCGYPTRTTREAMDEALGQVLWGVYIRSGVGETFVNREGWLFRFETSYKPVVLKVSPALTLCDELTNSRVNAKCELEAEWQGYTVTKLAEWNECYTSEWVVRCGTVFGYKVVPSVMRGIALVDDEPTYTAIKRKRSPEARNTALMAAALAGRARFVEESE